MGAATVGCERSGVDPRLGPAVSCVRVSYRDGRVRMEGDFCDRTPGRVNALSYVFTINTSDGRYLDSTEPTADQTLAWRCAARWRC